MRNILVHEIPPEKPFQTGDIGAFLDHTEDLMHASEEYFAFLLYGEYPMTQAEMSGQAAQENAAALDELAVVCQAARERMQSDEIDHVQALWIAFKDAEAERQAQRHLGGTIRPMLYSLASASLTKTRKKELQQWLDNSGD